MPGRFAAMVGALIWRESDGKYLVLQRAGTRDVGGGEWEGVTGRLEQGESFLQALRREVFEEVGLHVQVEFILRIAHFFRGTRSPENEMVGVYYGCSARDASTMRLSEEHDAYAWLDRKEIASLHTGSDRLLALVDRADTLRLLAPETLQAVYRSDAFDF